MMAIVDSAEMWASNVSFLNDRKELLYGLEAAVVVVKEFSSQQTRMEWNRTLQKAVLQLQKGEMPNTYAACFCERSDTLSQWRGYGGIEQGIAITFDRIQLTKTLKESKATLLPVVYGNLKAKDQLTSELSSKLDDLDQEAALGGGYSEEVKIEKARSILSRLIPQFKHLGFSDEREWRFVVQQDSLRASVDFRANSNVLIPYVKLPIGPKGKLPIRSILIGPGRDQILTKRSVELFLESRGYAGNIEVKISGVPYRV
jgi:DUF2971 family protein